VTGTVGGRKVESEKKKTRFFWPLQGGGKEERMGDWRKGGGMRRSMEPDGGKTCLENFFSPWADDLEHGGNVAIRL